MKTYFAKSDQYGDIPIHLVDVADDWTKGIAKGQCVRTRCNRRMRASNVRFAPVASGRECRRCGSPDDFQAVRNAFELRQEKRKQEYTDAREERDRINNSRSGVRRDVTEGVHSLLTKQFKQPLHATINPLVSVLKGEWLVKDQRLRVTIRIESEPATVSASYPPTVNPHSWEVNPR